MKYLAIFRLLISGMLQDSGIFGAQGGFYGSAGFPTGPIVADNGNIVITGIQSPGFVSGSTGWQIKKDGSAEFNNLTVRGTFFGTDFELNSKGLFFYSGTPALGNLVLSIAQAAGTDEFGNAFLPHFVAGLNTKPQAQLKSTASGAGQLTFPLNNVAFPGLALVNTSIQTGPPSFAQLSIFGPSTSAAATTDLVAEAFNSNNSIASGSGNKQSGYFDATGAFNFYTLMDTNGFTILVGSITGKLPGTGGTPANPGKPEVWHDMRPLTGSFIGTISGQYPPQYRMMADGTVEISGFVQMPPGATSNYNAITFATLPVAYRPTANAGRRWLINGIPVGLAPPICQIDTTGAMQFHFMPTTGLGSSIADISGFYPLDVNGMILS